MVEVRKMLKRTKEILFISSAITSLDLGSNLLSIIENKLAQPLSPTFAHFPRANCRQLNSSIRKYLASNNFYHNFLWRYVQ